MSICTLSRILQCRLEDGLPHCLVYKISTSEQPPFFFELLRLLRKGHKWVVAFPSTSCDKTFPSWKQTISWDVHSEATPSSSSAIPAKTKTHVRSYLHGMDKCWTLLYVQLIALFETRDVPKAKTRWRQPTADLHDSMSYDIIGSQSSSILALTLQLVDRVAERKHS